jgi:RHS repeat-associated protein
MPTSPATILYRRDLLGRIVAAGDGSDPKAFGAWTYNADGSVASETLGAGAGAVTRSFAYDGLGRPVRIAEPAATLDVSYRKGGAFDGATPYADGSITAERITYSAAGFPAGSTVPPGSTTTYAYDAWGRLTGATSADRPALDVAAAYDADGNLTSLAQAGTSRAYAYAGATNRLASVTPAGGPAQPYTHDAAGAVTDASGTTLVRDPATGQARRGSKGGQAVSVLRDARGRIALTTQGTAKRLTVRDGRGQPLAERDGAALASVEVHGATGRIAVWTADQLYAVSKDLRGSTRILYKDGEAASWLSYRAYGATDTGASSTTIPTRWRYTGQEWVEPLALYDYGARLYDPALGRFLSPDPKDETPSPYMYVAGDPVNAVDPDGEGTLDFWLKIENIRYFFAQGKIAAKFSGGTKEEVIHWLSENHIEYMHRNWSIKSSQDSPFLPTGTPEMSNFLGASTRKKQLFSMRHIERFLKQKQIRGPRAQVLLKNAEKHALFKEGGVAYRINNVNVPGYSSMSPDQRKSVGGTRRDLLAFEHHFPMRELRDVGFSELEIRIGRRQVPPSIAHPIVLDLRGLGARHVVNFERMRARAPAPPPLTAVLLTPLGSIADATEQVGANRLGVALFGDELWWEIIP